MHTPCRERPWSPTRQSVCQERGCPLLSAILHGGRFSCEHDTGQFARSGSIPDLLEGYMPFYDELAGTGRFRIRGEMPVASGSSGRLVVDVRSFDPKYRRALLFAVVDKLVELDAPDEHLIVSDHDPSGITLPDRPAQGDAWRLRGHLQRAVGWGLGGASAAQATLGTRSRSTSRGSSAASSTKVARVVAGRTRCASHVERPHPDVGCTHVQHAIVADHQALRRLGADELGRLKEVGRKRLGGVHDLV